mgnify:CR=1 FL=1
MAIATHIADLEKGKFKESSVTGQPGVVVINADGSSFGSTGPYSTITSGKKIITTAGTAATFVASSTPCKKVDIQAYLLNAGNVAIGGSTIDASATLDTGNGIILEPGDSYTIYTDDVVDLYLDILINGDGVRFNYFN